jgi:hypothetical protein
MMFGTKELSSAAIEVLGQLFVGGPVWDGNVCSKVGRGELVRAGLAFHENGWASLTPEGVRTAVEWNRVVLAGRNDQRWLKKLRAS